MKKQLLERIASEYKDSDGYWINLKAPWTVDDCVAIHEPTKTLARARLDECIAKPELHA